MDRNIYTYLGFNGHTYQYPTGSSSAQTPHNESAASELETTAPSTEDAGHGISTDVAVDDSDELANESDANELETTAPSTEDAGYGISTDVAVSDSDELANDPDHGDIQPTGSNNPADEKTDAAGTPEAKPKITKRAARKAEFNCELGADNAPKGEVRFTPNGNMEHKLKDTGTWQPAIYHNQIRRELIDEASLLGQYDHPRESGYHPDDVTSFLPSQKSWGPDRDNDWPQVQDNVLHRMERNGYPIPSYTPEIWYRHGCIVLDSDNHPILTYRDLPATISSAYSGQDQETVRRLDCRITLKDIRARMPSAVQISKDNQNTKSLCSLSALGMRMTRFREQNGMVAWKDREGGDALREYWINRMPEANRLANTTQGMPRPTKAEIRESKLQNRGKYLSRAGGRALPDEIRKDRNESFDRKLEKLKEKEQNPEITAGSSRKRRRRNSISPVSDEQSSQSKKQKKSQPILPGFADTPSVRYPSHPQHYQTPYFPLPSQYPDPTMWNQVSTEPWSATPQLHQTYPQTPSEPAAPYSLGPAQPDFSVLYPIQWALPLTQDYFAARQPYQPQPQTQTRKRRRNSLAIEGEGDQDSEPASKRQHLEAPTETGPIDDQSFDDFLLRSLQDHLYPESLQGLSAFENQTQANMLSDVWRPPQNDYSYSDSSQLFSQTTTNIQPEIPIQPGTVVSSSPFSGYLEQHTEAFTFPLLETFPFTVETTTPEELPELDQDLKDWLAQEEKRNEEELRLQEMHSLQEEYEHDHELEPELTGDDVTSNQTNNQTSQAETEEDRARPNSDLESWEAILNQFVNSDPTPEFEPIP